VKQKRFNVGQINAVLKQAEAGVPLVEQIRRVGITVSRWVAKSRVTSSLIADWGIGLPRFLPRTIFFQS